MNAAPLPPDYDDLAHQLAVESVGADSPEGFVLYRNRLAGALDEAEARGYVNAIDTALRVAHSEWRTKIEAVIDRWERMAEDTPNPWDRVTIRSHADHLRALIAEEPS